jgi:2-hydroxycyclohexanecarboxyl-CoA dehydrogenase
MKDRTLRLAPGPAVVTGAGRGIGRATSLALAKAGCEVLAVDLDEDAAKETAMACRGPVPAHAYRADVADPESVHTFAEQLRSEHGTPAILVNNAGIGMSAPFLDTTVADWQRIVSINVMGIIHMCGELVPAMLTAGSGHVVNMASGLGYIPTATEPAYCATKAAVISISRSTRADWRRHGVSVSAVCPGVINTGILERTTFRGKSADEAAVARTKRIFAKGHPPEIVARAVLNAIERDRAIVPAGIEAHFGWTLRHLPAGAWDGLARISARVR